MSRDAAEAHGEKAALLVRGVPLDLPRCQHGGMGSRMVGREVQLAALRRLATSAAGGEPGAALVLGEAGIGKTRLVTELVDELRHEDVCVLQGHCTAAGSRDVPLGPLLDAVRDLRRVPGRARFEQVAGGRLADVRRLLPELGGPPADGEIRDRSAPRTGAGATAGLLREAASTQPLLLVLEDVHWADQSSRDVLDYLVRSMRDERLAVVLTVRTDDPAYDDVSEFVAELGSLRRATRVELGRLGREDVVAQVRELDAAGPTEAADIERILEVSGGVPLLVEELVASGASDLDQLADRLLGHRVRRLDTQARSVVDAAAVALVDIRLDDLAAVVDLTPEDFDTGVAGAVSGGVLVRRAGSDRVPARAAPRGRSGTPSPRSGDEVAPRVGRAARRIASGDSPRRSPSPSTGPQATGRGRRCTPGCGPPPSPSRSRPTPSRRACCARRRSCGPAVPPDERPAGHRPGGGPDGGSGGGDARSRAPGGQPGAAHGGARGPASRRSRGSSGVARRPVGPQPLAPGRPPHLEGGRRDGRRHPRRPAHCRAGRHVPVGRRASAGVARTSQRPTPSARRRLRWPGPSVTSS